MFPFGWFTNAGGLSEVAVPPCCYCTLVKRYAALTETLIRYCRLVYPAPAGMWIKTPDSPTANSPKNPTTSRQLQMNSESLHQFPLSTSNLERFWCQSIDISPRFRLCERPPRIRKLLRKSSPDPKVCANRCSAPYSSVTVLLLEDTRICLLRLPTSCSSRRLDRRTTCRLSLEFQSHFTR